MARLYGNDDFSQALEGGDIEAASQMLEGLDPQEARSMIHSFFKQGGVDIDTVKPGGLFSDPEIDISVSGANVPDNMMQAIVASGNVEAMRQMMDFAGDYDDGVRVEGAKIVDGIAQDFMENGAQYLQAAMENGDLEMVEALIEFAQETNMLEEVLSHEGLMADMMAHENEGIQGAAMNAAIMTGNEELINSAQQAMAENQAAATAPAADSSEPSQEVALNQTQPQVNVNTPGMG